ncbi:MAG: hypothetical protein GKR89_02875 [Candidatus Latescibacteria bacterium]|nr:hypothetical protein [Candidatus Latescibacterota bacterium]
MFQVVAAESQNDNGLFYTRPNKDSQLITTRSANVKVFIQNEAGSKTKNFHNEKTLEYQYSTQVSRPYPYPYGFILDTTADDGCNVDCYILTGQSLPTGTIVDCEPIALLEQIEDDEVDHNILAVMPGETAPDQHEYLAVLTDFIHHVFDHIKGKQIEVGRLLSTQTALDHIKSQSDSSARPST